MLSRPVCLVVVALTCAASTRPVLSQSSLTANTRTASRADLERLQSSYDQLAASTAYSERTRAKARTQAEEVRRRLRDGDVRVGDRMLLRIGGAVAFNDTITVSDGVRLQIPGVRLVELRGVLHSELEPKVTAEVREIVREATVNVRPLMRVAVFGAVTRPGYLSVPPETTLDQLLSLAGGPTANARTEQLRLLRGEVVVMRPGEVFDAIASGLTLDALDVREGDVMDVGRRDQGWQMTNTVQLITVLVSPLITFLLLR